MRVTSNAIRLTLAMTFVVLLVGTYEPLSAQALHGSTGIRAPSFPADIPDADTPTPAVATNHVLERTYFNSGVYDNTVPASTYTPIDKQLTVVCPAGPCTISAHRIIENGEGSHSGNQVTVVLFVDGSPVNCCYYTGLVPPDGTWINVTQDTVFGGFATGHHTVQTYYYTSYGAFVANYVSAYSVYEP